MDSLLKLIVFMIVLYGLEMIVSAIFGTSLFMSTIIVVIIIGIVSYLLSEGK